MDVYLCQGYAFANIYLFVREENNLKIYDF